MDLAEGLSPQYPRDKGLRFKKWLTQITPEIELYAIIKKAKSNQWKSKQTKHNDLRGSPLIGLRARSSLEVFIAIKNLQWSYNGDDHNWEN